MKQIIISKWALTVIVDEVAEFMAVYGKSSVWYPKHKEWLEVYPTMQRK